MIRQARLMRALITVAALAGVAGAAFAASVPAASASPASSSGSSELPAVSTAGYFSARYVFRSAETASSEHVRDQDIFAELRMDMSSPRSGRYEFHFLGNVRGDLDNNQNAKTFDPLEDIGNTAEHRYFGNIYEAHLDINDLTNSITQVRLGRQAGTRDEGIFFDGIAADVRLAQRMHVTLYGGAAVHFFEIDNGQGPDFLGGAGLDYTPSAWTGMSLDYLSVSDKRNYLGFTDQKDSLLSFRLWQRFSRSLKATAKLRYQDGETRDLSLRLLGTFPDQGAEFGAAYFRQFTTQGEQTNELSPFYDVMGASYPYQTFDLKLRKLFGSRYAVDVGYYRRTMLNRADIGTFNRDYSRASAALTISDLLVANLSLMVAGDSWTSDSSDSYSGSADLTYQFWKSGRVSVGTYYSLYKYDTTYQLEEHDRVRTYYVSTRLPLTKQFSANGSYELEKGIDTYHVMKAGIRYDF